MKRDQANVSYLWQLNNLRYTILYDFKTIILHNKPKAKAHLGRKLTGPKEEEEDYNK